MSDTPTLDPQTIIDRLREPVNSRARMHAMGTITPPSATELLAVESTAGADGLLEHLFLEWKHLTSLRDSLAKVIPTMPNPTDSMALLQGVRDVLAARLDQAISDLNLMRHVLGSRFVLTDPNENTGEPR